MRTTSFLLRAALQLSKRLLYSLPAVFIVVTLVFALIHLVPGDPVEQGCILAISVTYIVVNGVTDLLYSILDPRIRES